MKILEETTGFPYLKSTGALFPGIGSEKEGMLSTVKAEFLEHLRQEAQTSSEIGVQLGIYAASTSLWEKSRRKYDFSLLAGHSLGFYSALFASGSINFQTGLYLIRTAHWAIMDVAGKQSFGMTAVNGINKVIVDRLCKRFKDLYISNINSSSQVVVSGLVESLESFEKSIIKEGPLKIKRLTIRHPLHTPILKGVSDIMKKSLSDIELRIPKIPVVDHTSGEIITSSGKLKDILIEQFSKRVIWMDVIRKMWHSGVRRFIEVGPRNILTSLTKKIVRDAESLTLDR
ncbi:MAG: ACP S-malonyltransferase [Nitrospirota bacterium]